MQSDKVRSSIKGALCRIARWRSAKVEKDNSKMSSDFLPPFLAAKAVYNDRLRMAKAFSVGVVLVSAGIVTLQELRFRGSLERALNKEFLIVPGVVDFMKVRPNLVPDNVVFYFAEYISEQIGTFSFQNVEDKYPRIAEFMTPQLREMFLAEMRKNLKLYREVAVSEIFNPKPAEGFKQVKDSAGNPYYHVDIHGIVDKYSNDQKIDSRSEVVSLEFRTTRILPDKPWFFEVTSIRRLTFEEFKKEEDAKRRLAQSEGDTKQ